MTDKPFLMSPEVHRERAAELRKIGTPSAIHLAMRHEMLAREIEKRTSWPLVAPPLDPD